MKQWQSWLAAAFIVFTAAACHTAKIPQVAFERSLVPAAPDYSDPNHWAALPTMKDHADLVPSRSSFSNNQQQAQADVFYIHPTTYFDGEAWNADLNDKKVNHLTDSKPVMHQASIFNGSCRVFAPRYRQAHLRAFDDSVYENTGQRALRLAYQDVRTAFQYYLDHYNNGRPIVIASHSQGTWHAVNLLQAFFDNQPLQNQLVAAYIVGIPVKADYLQTIQPCESPDDNGCYVSWCTFAWDYFPDNYEHRYKGAVVTNPLCWSNDSSYAPPERHKGVVLYRFRKLFKKAVDAKCQDGILWVHPPRVPGSWLIRYKNYHVADYNLFYGNIRENVEQRINRFTETLSSH